PRGGGGGMSRRGRRARHSHRATETAAPGPKGTRQTGGRGSPLRVTTAVPPPPPPPISAQTPGGHLLRRVHGQSRCRTPRRRSLPRLGRGTGAHRGSRQERADRGAREKRAERAAMTVLLDVAIRSSVVLAVGLLLNALLGSRSAALRHRVLVGALLGAAAVTPMGLLLPEWTVTLPAHTVAPTGALAPVTSDRVTTVVAAPPESPSPRRTSPIVV